MVRTLLFFYIRRICTTFLHSERLFCGALESVKVERSITYAAPDLRYIIPSEVGDSLVVWKEHDCYIRQNSESRVSLP